MKICTCFRHPTDAYKQLRHIDIPRNINLQSVPFELKRNSSVQRKNPLKNPTLRFTKLRYIALEMNYMQGLHLTHADNATEKKLFS